MILKRLTHTLRFKLVASSVLIQIIFVSLLVSNSVKLIENSLAKQSEVRISELEGLLNSSLATPFVQQDYEVIQEILDENIKRDGIIQLSLYDMSGQMVASSGQDEILTKSSHALSLKESIDADSDTHNSEMPISIAGVEYGSLHYGISLATLNNAKSVLVEVSVLISIIGIVLTGLALFLTSMWLTRNLSRLADASESFAEGKLNTRIDVKSNDEVKYLAKAFNSMAIALETRIQDLNDSREVQENLLHASQQEKARLTSLLSVMTRGILFETIDERVAYYNPAFANFWQFDDDAYLNGRKIDEVVKGIDQKIRADKLKTNLLKKSADAEKVELELTNGRIIIQRQYPVYDENQAILGTLWIFEDVTSERQTAEQLIHLAEHDALTGLFNRRKFQEEMQHQLDLCKRNGCELALVFFDVDDFKYINDGFGHKYGDEILVKVASDVSKLTRKEEYLFRLGGDEFAVLLPNANKKNAFLLAERVLSAVSNISLSHEGKRIHVTSSIGISLFPTHALNIEELLACADIAMYQAKSAGKNTYKLYEKDLDSSHVLHNRINWDNTISKALEEGDFKLNFQGVYDSYTNELFYLEALARIRNPSNMSYTMPGQFIPFAEQSGKILEIDRWVIKEVIQTLSIMPYVPCIAVNISGRSFDDPTLENYIIENLERLQVKPHRLMLELTETAAVSDLHDAQRFIQSM
ncbi:MAG: diguanylate cyclase, partial [Gammaproteobacteria bacterium]|nr:diguanylate cyclase [Gammaproteobacteria bacterium]